MNPRTVAKWMEDQISKDGYLYQEDVVDFLVRSKFDDLLRENSDGNLVLGKEILAHFRSFTLDNVVWVKPDRYWRYRVPEDEPGRDARG